MEELINEIRAEIFEEARGLILALRNALYRGSVEGCWSLGESKQLEQALENFFKTVLQR